MRTLAIEIQRRSRAPIEHFFEDAIACARGLNREVYIDLNFHRIRVRPSSTAASLLRTYRRRVEETGRNYQNVIARAA